MKILITGAFGFVGTNLSAYLAEKGHELWALDVASVGNKQSASGNKQEAMGKRQWPSGQENDSRQDAKAQRGGGANAQRSTLNAQRSSFELGAYVRCYGWEELEKIPWLDVDAVIHLAGKAHDTRNASDPQSYFDVNVGLTKKVLQSAMGSWQLAIGKGSYSRQDAKTQSDGQASMVDWQNGKAVAAPANLATPANQLASLKRFILFSSVKAVADRVEGVLTEDAVPDPKTPYGQSKLEAEKEVLKCGSSKVRESGETTANNANDNHFRTYILRPCMIHGPGNKGNLNLLHGVVSKGMPWPLGAFENKRSFASIMNVCAAVDGFLTGNAPSGIYQVADDEPLSTNDLIGLIAESLGRRARIWKMPAGLVRQCAKVGDVLRLPLNSERLKKLTESYVVSNVKVKKALGWNSMPIRAEDGMRKTLGSFGK